ncbi:hypothetical protein Bca4012_068043 [Brassica carinata]
MSITKTSVALVGVVILAIISFNYNVLAVSVINPTKAGPCITKCNATYHYHECNHDCLIDGFNDGNCDPKTQMCCCTSHPPNN